MGFFDSLRNIKKWFTDKTGITVSSESIKRKHDECDTISNKRARMDDSLVEVVEISDESLSEAEDVEITEPGPSTVPLRASPPVMLIDGKHHQMRTLPPAETIDLTENSDDETHKLKIIRSYSLSGYKCMPNSTIGLVRSASFKSSLEDKLNSSTSLTKGEKKCIYCNYQSICSIYFVVYYFILFHRI